MILVVLGTTKYPFTRPLKELELLKKENRITCEIIVQSGYTEFRSNLLEVYDFFSPERMDELYNKANLIISHGGTGSIIKGLYMNKKLIVIPRLSKFREHIDDHQLEVTNELAYNGFILKYDDGEDLMDLIDFSNKFEPEKYISNTEVYVDYLSRVIENI